MSYLKSTEVAALLNIQRGSVMKAMSRYGVKPLGKDGLGHLMWDTDEANRVAGVYQINKIAKRINPDWKEPLFKSKKRRPVLTKDEHDRAVAKARINALREKINAKKEREARSG